MNRCLQGLLLVALMAWANDIFAAIEADVACCYSPSYATSVGGEDNAQVLLANTLTGSNLINDQSGTGARMRIAGFYQSTNDPINQTTTGGMVGWLASDARMQNVRDFGVSVGADLVTYVCQNTDSASIAAVAQQPGIYSALNPGAVYYVVFAHEVGGHNYGMSHADGLLNPKTVMLHNYCGGGANSYYTNPNIFLNGVQLLGDGNNCSQGSLIFGGDNAGGIASQAQDVADRRARVVVGPNLNNVVYRWSFNNPAGSAPASTTILDQVSSAPAIVRGNGATFTGSALRLPGGTTGNVAANSISAYIDLPNGIISARTNLTVEIWAIPLSAPNWTHILDFGRPVQAGDGLGAAGEYTGMPGSAAPGVTQSSDDIMLSAAIGTDINQQRFEAKLNGGTAITLNSALPTTAGVQHHYAITFADGVGDYGSAGGRWQWYRDGDAIAYLDVNFHLASIEDVNNWLGRSMWSADSNANTDYAEVRISSVALARGEVLANYLLGPNYTSNATVLLTKSDASGASSFNAAGGWSNAATPAATNSYEALDFSLRTPAASGSYAFGGNALKVSGGTLLYKGAASGAVITVNNLTLNGGEIRHDGTGSWTLAGNLTVSPSGATFNGVNGQQTIAAGISGGGPLTYLDGPTVLSGSNASFTGKTYVGNGAAGTLVIDSQARLGAVPTAFTSDQVTLNRGTLQTTATMALNDANRGILLGTSGGIFSVASGTTLTLASTLSSPATATNVVAGSLSKTGAGTMILSSAGSGFKGTLYVDSSSTTANDGIVKVVNNQVLANAHSPIFIRNNNGGSSTLQLDGSTGSIALPQKISLNGRTSASAAIQNLAGTNTISGGISINTGGSNYWIQSDAGSLNLGGAITSVATGTRAFTFQGNGDVNVSGVISNGSATTVNVNKLGAGTLTMGGVNTFSGALTASAGTLNLTGSIAGALTLNSGSALSPNAGAASTLNVPGLLTLNGGAALNFELGAASDKIALAGGYTAPASGVVTINISDLSGFGVGSYPLITGATGISASSFALGAAPAAYTYALSASSDTLSVTVSQTPVQLWRYQNFGTIANSGNAADSADPDGDGMTNAQEFSSGTNPNDRTSLLKISQIQPSGNDLVISFPTANGKTYRLEYSNTLADGSWAAVLTNGVAANNIAGTGSAVQVTDTNAALQPKRFYRLTVNP